MAFFEKQIINDPFAKMNDDVDAAKAELEASYNALGKACFGVCGDDGRFAAQIEEIKASKKKVEILTELRVRMRGMKVCRECGAEVPLQSVFCNLCGSKIPEPEPLCDGDKVYCNNCASPMKIGQVFCSFCGARLPLAEEAPAAEAPAEEAPAFEEPAASTVVSFTFAITRKNRPLKLPLKKFPRRSPYMKLPHRKHLQSRRPPQLRKLPLRKLPRQRSVRTAERSFPQK